jgi:hypothetical protein
MLEQFQPPRATHGPGPDGLGDIFTSDAGPDLVTCQNGPYTERLPLVGMSVAQVRARYSDRFDLDSQSIAYINGMAVSDSHRINAGETLLFSHKSGEKGTA